MRVKLMVKYNSETWTWGDRSRWRTKWQK